MEKGLTVNTLCSLTLTVALICSFLASSAYAHALVFADCVTEVGHRDETLGSFGDAARSLPSVCLSGS